MCSYDLNLWPNCEDYVGQSLTEILHKLHYYNIAQTTRREPLTQHEHGRERVSDSRFERLQHDVEPEGGGEALGEAQRGAHRAREHRGRLAAEPVRDLALDEQAQHVAEAVHGAHQRLLPVVTREPKLQHVPRIIASH